MTKETLNNKIHYLNYCGLPWNILMIDSFGDFGPCCDKVLGNMSEYENISSIWNGEDLVSLRKGLVGGNVSKMCSDCVYLKQMIRKEYASPEEIKDIWGGLRPNPPDKICKRGPKVITVDFTSKCNLRCIMCKGDGLERINNREMDIETIEELSSLFFSGLESLIVGGGGELFCHSNYHFILDSIIKNRPKISSINTNGTVSLSFDEWGKCVEAFDVVMFSIDALNEKTYEKIRGKNHFSQIFRNIDILRKMKKRKGFRFGFNFVIMDTNVEEMYDFTVKAVEKWGASQINFMHVHGHNHYSVCKNGDLSNKYNEEMKKIHRYSKTKNEIIFTLPGFIQ